MSTQRTVKVPFRGARGEDKGELEVPLHHIDERVRYPLLKEAVVMYGANQRRGTHSTKIRSAVAGSNKKPWRQKGTGRARAGSKKSPIWVGGGIVFGPHPRDYSYSIHRKQRRLALKSALLSKFVDGEVVVVDNLRLEEPKTKHVHEVLEALGIQGSCLIGTKDLDKNLVRAARNIPGVLVASLKDFNTLDVINARKLVLSREAFEALCGTMDGSGDATVDSGISTTTAPGISTMTAPGISTMTAPGISTTTAPGISTTTAPGISTTPAPGSTSPESGS